MRFNIDQNVKVVKCYSGANFKIGDIVKIVGIGFEDDPNCYECVNVENIVGYHWYLYEDEVEAISNADKIRSMTNEELAEFLELFNSCNNCRKFGNDCFSNIDITTWLQEEYKSEKF